MIKSIRDNKVNSQQYPKDITGIVIPREHFTMIDADYSQIEYRVLVALSGEKFLADLFEDPDNDYHVLMASLMYGVPYASVDPKMRGDAKSFNFGIPYGMGLGSLAILLTGVNNPITRKEAAEKYELYFKDQPNTRKFFDQVKEMAQVNKYTKTFWNRYRYYSWDDPNPSRANAKKAMALRQAGNAVIQGTAADIFKIAVARNFMYIRQNKLLGLLLIINMVHDEQLFEVNCEKLNIQRVLRDLGVNMQFKVDGFPPLFIGAGIGSSWAKSKGKMAEIHPHLLDELSIEAANMPIFADKPMDVKDVIKYFDERVFEFRKQKVMKYITNPENYGKDLHPAIGNLLNLQFSFGHDKDKEGLSDDAFTTLCLKEFMDHYGINLEISLFKTSTKLDDDIEEDEEYSDDEDSDGDIDDSEIGETDFALIDEGSEIFGMAIQDLIKQFGLVVSKQHRICGIDMSTIHYSRQEELIDFLAKHKCEKEDDESMQIVFLRDGNVPFNTGVYVRDISGSEIATKFRLTSSMYA